MPETTEQSLIKFEELPAVMENASEIFAKNRKVMLKGQEKAQALLDTIEAEGMSEDLYKACEKFLVQCRNAKEQQTALRKPITQMFQEASKQFIALEAPFDSTKKDSCYSKIQANMDVFLQQEREKERERQAEIQRQQKVNQEKIDIRARIEKGIRDRYLEVLYKCKGKVSALLNEMTLENFAAKTQEIKNLPEVYPVKKFNEIKPPVTSVYLKADEIDQITAEVRDGLYLELSDDFRVNMEDMKFQAVRQLPARQQELEDMAKASAAEKKKLEEAARLRKEEQDRKNELEAEEARKEAAKQAELNKDLVQAEAQMETELQISESKSDRKVHSREGYKIVVKSLAGWQQIASFWFSKVAGDISVDKAEKKSLGQMAKEVAKWSHKHDEIIDSDHLEYIEEIKAVARA